MEELPEVQRVRRAPFARLFDPENGYRLWDV